MTTLRVISNTQKEECIDFKFIGKNKFDFIPPPMAGENWTFTPSGRIGAHYRTFGRKKNDCYIFTFIDLMNKTCYEIPLIYKNEESSDDADKMDCFYFTAEDELIVVSGFYDSIKQLVYKVNYNRRKLELQETILHNFTKRDEDNEIEPQSITDQHAKFIRCDRIDYVVLVSYGSPENEDETTTYAIYLVPKYPIDKSTHMKEFHIHLREADLVDFHEKVNANFTYIESEIDVTLDESTAVLNGTKLMFSCKLDRPDTVDVFTPYPLGTLIGAHWEVDLAILKDISQVKHQQEYKKLMNEQDGFGKFVQRGDLRISDWLHLLSYENDVGMIAIVDNKLKEFSKYGASSALVYQSNMIDGGQAITLKCKIESEYGEHRYALHPRGALLHFSFSEGYFVRLRVLKCLKPNLMSLAFNRSLFHRNTPIKNHPVYRLFFKNILKYNDIPSKRGLKRKFF